MVMPRHGHERVYANEEAIRAYTEAIALTPDTDRERFDLLLSAPKPTTWSPAAASGTLTSQSCSAWPRH